MGSKPATGEGSAAHRVERPQEHDDATRRSVVPHLYACAGNGVLHPARWRVPDLSHDETGEGETRRAAGTPRTDNVDTALSERTLDDYEFACTVCKVFGDMHPRAFKPTDAARYLKMRRQQGHGVRANKEMSALSSAFNYGMTSGAVESNPCRGYRRNPERPRTRKVSIPEFNEFLAFAQNKSASSYLVALIGCCVALTGRRRGEILRLPKTAMTEAGINVKTVRRSG
jgi:hypothetical protein